MATRESRDVRMRKTELKEGQINWNLFKTNSRVIDVINGWLPILNIFPDERMWRCLIFAALQEKQMHPDAGDDVTYVNFRSDLNASGC
ncbi:hypothetical protein [Burkholderia sp. Ac-20353]|uniref:hypothetical protein n=1 Tax=Burkholderia sp. Ac-20353 TaxID=2703894 RepID=UPI00197B502A|nr:hypothetical protein [Burkholderia sp. Ac-20353]MBN3791137.1 hypothetical protein [Burkholderia sp. Ac-20353]